MNRSMTFEEVERLLRQTVLQEGAGGEIDHTLDLFLRAETDGERLAALVVGLQALEGSLRETRRIAADLLQKRPPASVVIPQTIAQQLGSEDAPPMKFYQLPVGARFVFCSAEHKGSTVCVKTGATKYSDGDEERRNFSREEDIHDVMIVED